MTNNENFNNRCYGIVIIKSENSNFNADFTGNPRRLPDENGTIYATDKSFKYPIRRYWVDYDKDVFVWRSHSNDGNLRTRDERMVFMKNILAEKHEDLQNLINIEAWLEKNKQKKKKNDLDLNNDIKQLEDIIKYLKKDNEKTDLDKGKFETKISEVKKEITATIFSKCIDTKLFGVTYTGEGPLSLTGPVQISYGINKYNDNTNYINDILSPYPTSDEGTTQASIGKEKKTLCSYYVYDFSINPKNIITHYNDSEQIKKLMSLSEDDINSLKGALKFSVTALDTSSKKDSENALLLFITLKEGSKTFLPAMKNLVEVKNGDDGKILIDLTSVKELLQTKKDAIKSIELYYNKIYHHVHPENLENWTIDDNL